MQVLLECCYLYMESSQWENLNHLFCLKGLFLIGPRWNFTRCRSRFEADLSVSEVFLISMEQIQRTSKHNIRSATICDYLQYTNSNNIRLSTIYYQQQYKIVYNIWSVTIYDYRQYAIGDTIRVSIICDQWQYAIICTIWSATIYGYLQHTSRYRKWSVTVYDNFQYTISYNIRSSKIWY